MPPLPADSIHARACKLKCEKILTRPYGENIFDVTDSLIQDAADDLAGLPEYAGCDTAAKAPEPVESFRRVKKYQYEMLGIVYPPKGEKNFLIDFGIVEVCDDNRG